MKRRFLRFLGAVAALIATPAMAADMSVRGCDYVSDMRNIVEPWSEYSRTFYNGQVRVALADTVEPACCSFHLVILMPDPESELGDRKCVAIGSGDGNGFSGFDFDRLKANYDPAVGLILSVPHRRYDHNTGASGSLRFGRVILNLSTGTVRAD